MPLLILNDRSGINLPTPNGLVSLNPKTITNIDNEQWDFIKKEYPVIQYMLDNKILDISKDNKIFNEAVENKVQEFEIKTQDKRLKQSKNENKK